MAPIPELSTEEQEKLNKILAGLSEQAKRAITLEGLLDKWIEFVKQVEQGYTDSIYEYINDLSARDLLAEIIRKVPRAFQEKLMPLVQPWDKRFFAATKKRSSPLGQWREAEAPDWWMRVPINLKGELKEDLRFE